LYLHLFITAGHCLFFVYPMATSAYVYVYMEIDTEIECTLLCAADQKLYVTERTCTYPHADGHPSQY